MLILIQENKHLFLYVLLLQVFIIYLLYKAILAVQSPSCLRADFFFKVNTSHEDATAVSDLLMEH